MVIFEKDFQGKIVEKARGGEGSVVFRHIVQGDELPPNASLCTRIDFGPGDSVGYHIHENDSEIYIVIEGEFVVDDNNETSKVLRKGDVMITPKGKGHSIANQSDKAASIWAIVIDA